MVANLIVFRKKNKTYYKEKSPTPLSFWEGEFKKHYSQVEEINEGSKAIHFRIDSYINNTFVLFESDYNKGVLPDQVINTLESYCNYLLRLSHLPLSNNEMEKAAKSKPNDIDGLRNYSLGIILSTMKILLYSLYNPLSGIMRKEEEESTKIFQYLVCDIQSLYSVLLQRLLLQFPKLNNPIFHSLINPVVMNAVFCAASPYLESIIHTLKSKEDIE